MAGAVSTKYGNVNRIPCKNEFDTKEHLFYYIDKRHTGGWCGPGQRTTPSVVCQPTHRWPGQRTAPQPCSLLPLHRQTRVPASRGATTPRFLVPNSQLLTPQNEVDPTDATPAPFVSFFEPRPVFQLPTAPNAKAQPIPAPNQPNGLLSPEGEGPGVRRSVTENPTPPHTPGV